MITFVIFASCLLVPEVDWIAAGNRALDKGSPAEAAADFAKALDAKVRAGAPVDHLFDLRITLATAHLEAGEYREMEAVLEEAEKTAWQLSDGVSRAELLNAWSALHVKLGRLTAAEAELREARQIVSKRTLTGELLPTILHNLAGVEMRTGRYEAALTDEQEALRRLEKTLAPDHPTLIRGWASLASVQYLTGRPQEAKMALDRAIASAEKTYGPSHLFVADLLDSDAVVLDKLKLKKEAKTARTRADKIRGSHTPRTPSRPAWDVREALIPESRVQLLSK